MFADCLQIVRRAYMPGAISGSKGGFGIQRQGIHLRFLCCRVGVCTGRAVCTGCGPGGAPTGVEWRERYVPREAALALRDPKGFGVGPAGRAQAVRCCPIPPRFSKR